MGWKIKKINPRLLGQSQLTNTSDLPCSQMTKQWICPEAPLGQQRAWTHYCRGWLGYLRLHWGNRGPEVTTAGGGWGSWGSIGATEGLNSLLQGVTGVPEAPLGQQRAWTHYCRGWLGYLRLHWGNRGPELTTAGGDWGTWGSIRSTEGLNSLLQGVAGVPEAPLGQQRAWTHYCRGWLGYLRLHWGNRGPELTTAGGGWGTWGSIRATEGLNSLLQGVAGVPEAPLGQQRAWTHYCRGWLGYLRLHWGNRGPELTTAGGGWGTWGSIGATEGLNSLLQGVAGGTWGSIRATEGLNSLLQGVAGVPEAPLRQQGAWTHYCRGWLG